MKNEKLSEFQVKLLQRVKKALVNRKGGKVFATVRHVSKSGMSRVISFMYVDNKGGVYYLDGLFETLLNKKYDEKYRGLRIGGCGMDMIFHTLEQVLSSLKVKDAYQYAENYVYW